MIDLLIKDGDFPVRYASLLEGINGNKTLITKVIIYHYKPIYNLTKRHVKEGSSLGGGFDGDDDDDDDDRCHCRRHRRRCRPRRQAISAAPAPRKDN